MNLSSALEGIQLGLCQIIVLRRIQPLSTIPIAKRWGTKHKDLSGREQFFLPTEPAWALIENGERLAKTGEIQPAKDQFQQAKLKAACFKFEPQEKAQRIAARVRLHLLASKTELVVHLWYSGMSLDCCLESRSAFGCPHRLSSELISLVQYYVYTFPAIRQFYLHSFKL